MFRVCERWQRERAQLSELRDELALTRQQAEEELEAWEPLAMADLEDGLKSMPLKKSPGIDGEYGRRDGGSQVSGGGRGEL